MLEKTNSRDFSDLNNITSGITITGGADGFGKVIRIRGVGTNSHVPAIRPSVGIRDAAKAMLLAEEKGRVGERYIIAERWVDFKELFASAAKVAGVAPPKTRIHLFMLYAMAGIADVLSFITRKDNRLSVASIRCSTLLPDVDSAKARNELDWVPEPVEKSIEEAVNFYRSH